MTVFHFINRNMPAPAFEELKKILTKQVTDRRCKVMRRNGDAVNIEFSVDGRMKADSYKIAEKDGRILISANNAITVFAGAGRFLLLSVFDGKGGFTPCKLPVSHVMAKSIRGIYLATHFHNFHHNAPIEKECEHVAEQALRGFNAIMLCIGIQHYRVSLAEDPDAQIMIARLHQQIDFAKKIGMSVAMVAFSNTGLADFNREFAAKYSIEPDDTRFRNPIVAEFLTELCPSTEGGLKEIEKIQRDFFKAFPDIDYYYLWAYDEGGCLCDKCYPWATNGFIKCAELDLKIMEEMGIKGKLCISGWHFGINTANEWKIFYDELMKGKYPWCPYVMTYFNRVPEYFKTENVPNGTRFVDFPEISMQNPAKPWGGYGANPVPMFLNNVFEATGDIHDGGYLYSEGIYEDANKFIVSGFYCGYYSNTAEALRDYFRYEFGIEEKEIQDDLIQCCRLMESSLRRTVTAPATPDGAYTFLPRWGTAIPEVKRYIDKASKYVGKAWASSWKWRLFVIRANVDYVLYSNGWKMKDSEEAQALLAELNGISCVDETTKDCVLPALGK